MSPRKTWFEEIRDHPIFGLLEWLGAITFVMLFVLFASCWVGAMEIVWKRILT